MMDDSPSLFDWIPPRKILVFPMKKRVGKVRDVAVKMLDKPTSRAASAYYTLVTDSLAKSFHRLDIPHHEQEQHINAFWHAVDVEMARLSHIGRNTGGAA